MKQLQTIALLCLTLSLATLNAKGDTRQTKTLAQCLREALDKNYAIRIAENNRTSAEEAATRAAAGMLPTIELSGGYDVDMKSNRSTSRATGQTSSNINYVDNGGRAQVGIAYTLFDGFAMQANYQELQLLKSQGDLRRRMAVESLVSDLSAEYYNCVQQRIRLINLRNAMRLSKERMRIVEARYNVGNFSRLDYMQAKVDFNADSANYMKQKEALTTSCIALARLMADPSAQATFQVADTVIPVSVILNREELWEATLQNNTDIHQAAINTGLAEQELRKILARNYPYIKFNTSYGYAYNRYAVSANRRADTWGPSVGVTVGMNLWNGHKRADRNIKQRAIENARLEQQDTELALKAQFNTLWEAHANNLEVLRLETQNLDAAQENYDIARERYMLGDLSGFEMREAQQSLLDAEERILRAGFNTKMGEISLLRMAGRVEAYLTE